MEEFDVSEVNESNGTIVVSTVKSKDKSKCSSAQLSDREECVA